MAKKKKIDKEKEIPSVESAKQGQVKEAVDFAEKYLTQEQIDDLEKVKDPYMAADEKAWKELRQKQLDIKNSDVYKNKTFFVPTQAMVNVPLSGMFKQAIEDTLNYVFSTVDKEDLIVSMLKVQGGFKDLKPEQIKPVDMAIWTLLNLITEINFQAQEQGKLINTDDQFGDNISDMIDRMNSDPEWKFDAKELEKINKNYKETVPGATEINFDKDGNPGINVD
tara:strand:+ start:1704 stop:2372 length:669 start_codon:yes stop_codon:yes gene_type:complete